AGVESFYTAGNMEWPHLIDKALKAHHLYKRDKQYVVMRHPESGEMSIIIVEEFTGRLMIGRQWSDGLHQAVEAKHLRYCGMLKRRGVKHELLNAKPEYAAREAEIVSQAGRIGAVTIATNMAGRGTDIILGGNPETLAWARLKDKYATRLDVPEDEWKQTVTEIETREKMREEGRKVAEMGGLHIVGTERHEARRIDNQLRGRAGRQGDPGSSRFYLSLQDDLMRIFAGEWVASWLTRLGMEEGQGIES